MNKNSKSNPQMKASTKTTVKRRKFFNVDEFAKKFYPSLHMNYEPVLGIPIHGIRPSKFKGKYSARSLTAA